MNRRNYSRLCENLSPNLQYGYVVATIDVKEQKLKIFLDQFQIEEFDYKLRTKKWWKQIRKMLLCV